MTFTLGRNRRALPLILTAWLMDVSADPSYPFLHLPSSPSPKETSGSDQESHGPVNLVDDGEILTFEADGRTIHIGVVRPSLYYRGSYSGTASELIRATPEVMLSVMSAAEPTSVGPRGLIEIYGSSGSQWRPLEDLKKLSKESGSRSIIRGIEPNVIDALRCTSLSPEDLFAAFALNKIHFLSKSQSTPSRMSHDLYSVTLSGLLEYFILWSGVERSSLGSVDTMPKLFRWHRLQDGREFSSNLDGRLYLPSELGGAGSGITKIYDEVYELRRSYLIRQIRQSLRDYGNVGILTDQSSFALIEPELSQILDAEN